MNIKLNVKNVLLASALGGALVLTGCGAHKEAVGTVDVYSNNFSNDKTYQLQQLIDSYTPIDTPTSVPVESPVTYTENGRVQNAITFDGMEEKEEIPYEVVEENPTTYEVDNEQNNIIVDNTIQEGNYYTVKEALLINTDKNQIIATIGIDTYVKVLGENGSDYLVDFNGLIGYIPKDSVQAEQYVLYDDNTIEEYKPYTIRHMIRANNDVNIRTDMSTESEIVGILYEGNAVEIISHENGWYRIQYGDIQAFIKDGYCNEEFQVDGNILKVVYVTEDTELLKEDTNEAIRPLEFYESAEVLGDLGDYYLVNVDNVVGRIRKDACFPIEGKVVVVDLSSQTLKLYDEDRNVLLYTRVVTGKDTTPTDKGLYPIYDKATEAYLIGDDYEVAVNYWMPFNGGEGFHDATWREDFGGEIYHNDGSHGCVNMQLDDAEVLYNNVEVGNKVLIHK